MFSISVFYKLALITVFLTQEVFSLIVTATLHRSSNHYAALWSAGVELNGSDVASCAISCLQHIDFCHSFSFDEVTSQCKLGYCVIPSPTSTVSTVKLYQTEQELCETTPEFNIYTLGNLKACLWMSSTKKNFTDAAEHCAAMGSTLVTIKSEAKKAIVQLYTNSSIFIGLDDMTTEGVYVWHDDHTVMTNDTISQLFIEGEPNNIGGIEDCIEFRFTFKLCNDIPCSEERDYVCEKSCFVF